MRLFIRLAPALAGVVFLAGCGHADKAGDSASADNVEMPAEEAMSGVDPTAAPSADPSATATEGADSVADTAADGADSSDGGDAASAASSAASARPTASAIPSPKIRM
jgi:hypothetical protein